MRDVRILAVAGLAAAAASVTVRYRRDLADAEARLERVRRRTVETPFGRLEFCG
jgi:hypothetical protein